MASQDVLTTALQELLPGYKTTWDLFNPAIKKIVAGGRKQKHNHPYKQFGLVPEGPGSWRQMRTGMETIPGGRNQSGTKGSAYASRHIYAFDVPIKDLTEANGPADVLGLIKKYPERAVLDMQQNFGRQLVSGDVADLNTQTLNGDTTYTPDSGAARRGAFQFAAPSNQTHEVFGVTKNSIPGWYNQYGEITSMSGNGSYTMFETWQACHDQGQDLGSGIDVLLGDSVSFNNYRELLDNRHIAMSNRAVQDGLPGAGKVRSSLPFESAEFFHDPQIKLSAFSTTAATEGVIYMLCTNDWYIFYQGSGAKEATDGNFAAREPYRIPKTELLSYEFVLSMGMYTDNLRSQGVITGGTRR